MKAVAVLKPGKVAIVDIPMSKPGPYEVLVKSETAFICNATDRKIVQGHAASLGIGPDSYPLILGHETVGRVVEVAPKVTSFKLGDRILGGLSFRRRATARAGERIPNTFSQLIIRRW
jgi:D-arabinose 1-dehydrogenase-like Zn-dependent alcohol dehydrogenase